MDLCQKSLTHNLSLSVSLIKSSQCVGHTVRDCTKDKSWLVGPEDRFSLSQLNQMNGMLIYNDKKTTSHIMILADPRASKPTQVSGFSIRSSFTTNPLPSCYILYSPISQFKGHIVRDWTKYLIF